MTDREIPQGISLREFVFPGDYRPVYDLWSRAGSGIHLRQSDEPEEIQKKLTRDPDLFLVAELDCELIGTVLGGFDGRRGMMYHLAVEPAHRRRGVGRLLVEELERRLQAKGCIRYYLLVTRDNTDAVQFYENLGLKRMELYAYGKNLE